jgi:ribosomal protein S18 acetylase RimI-like enzyme
METLPLSQRVVAPATVAVPSLIGFRWRPASVGDLDAILELANAADRVDHPHYLTTRDELEDDLTASFVDVARDTMLAFADSGALVAFGFVLLPPGQETLVRSIIVGTVHPSWREKGIGRALLAWQEQRALQQLASSDKLLPGWIAAFTSESAIATTQLMSHAGFSVGRYFLELERDLSKDLPQIPTPEAFTIVQYDESIERELLAARNDAFRDHWGSQPTSEEQWTRFAARPILRKDLSFIARSPAGEIAGFLVTSVDENDWAEQGFRSAYIDLVGTTRAWRGRRIAPALLSMALNAMAADGLDRAVLDVDSESPTGALGLYVGVGFAEASRSMNFQKVY